jgi:hypothetical protein
VHREDEESKAGIAGVEVFDEFKAVTIGKGDVDDGKVGLMAGDGVESGGGRGDGGTDDKVWFAGEAEFKALPDDGMVIDEEDLPWR